MTENGLNSTEVNAERYRRELERLETLIERGEALSDERKFKRDRQTGSPKHYKADEDWSAYTQWKVNCRTILQKIFGEEGIHLEHFKQYPAMGGVRPKTVSKKTAVLKAAVEDVEGGYLLDQEALVASEVFDSVLQRAKGLCDAGYKDSSAVLGRVVLEDGLRRLANSRDIDATGQIGSVNDRLKEEGVLPKPRWRRVRSLIDIGSSAAHGDFDDYSHSDVNQMLDEIEKMLATEFAP